MNSPRLLSCWGFSFALGHGVAPHSRSSAYWFTGVFLILGEGYHNTAGPVKCSCGFQSCTWGICSRPLLLTLDVGISFWPLTAPVPHSHTAVKWSQMTEFYQRNENKINYNKSRWCQHFLNIRALQHLINSENLETSQIPNLKTSSFQDILFIFFQYHSYHLRSPQNQFTTYLKCGCLSNTR